CPPASVISRCFFFFPHSDLLVLLSFPTRRSSDLFSIIFTISPPGDRKRPFHPRLPPLHRPASSLYVDRIRDKLRCRRPPGRPHPDRKSTRLNSSHVKISYAVFCLKKKNLTSGVYR